jgi:hypothetical protein
MGANYIVFNLPFGPGDFVVNFNGENNTPWIVKILVWTVVPSVTYAEYDVPLDANKDGSLTITDPENWTYAAMVVCNYSQTLNDRSFAYGASFNIPNYAVQVSGEANDSLYSHTSTNVRFIIENTGTLADMFTLSATDQLGWSMSNPPASIFLDPGQLDTVSLMISSPALSPDGLMNWVSAIASATSAIGVSDSGSLSLRVLLQHGESDNSGIVDVSDVVYLVRFIFSGGPEPVPAMEVGDADCDTVVDISDCVYLIDYIFNGGAPSPCNPI